MLQKASYRTHKCLYNGNLQFWNQFILFLGKMGTLLEIEHCLEGAARVEQRSCYSTTHRNYWL